jgi:hypothetical protein
LLDKLSKVNNKLPLLEELEELKAKLLEATLLLKLLNTILTRTVGLSSAMKFMMLLTS